MLTVDQVRHIAKLARLGLTEEEIGKFAGQLDNILTYVAKLNEVDTSDVAATSQVTGLQNVLREDKEKRFSNQEELLGCTELPVVQDQIKVQSVITH